MKTTEAIALEAVLSGDREAVRKALCSMSHRELSDLLRGLTELHRMAMTTIERGVYTTPGGVNSKTRIHR